MYSSCFLCAACQQVVHVCCPAATIPPVWPPLIMQQSERRVLLFNFVLTLPLVYWQHSTFPLVHSWFFEGPRVASTRPNLFLTPSTPASQSRSRSFACTLVRAAATQAVHPSGTSDSADSKRERRGSVDATESAILASDSDRLRTANRDINSSPALGLGGDGAPLAQSSPSASVNPPTGGPNTVASRGPPAAQSGRRQQKRKRTASTTRAAGRTAAGNSQRAMSKNLPPTQKLDLPPDALPVPSPGKHALAG